MKSPALYLADGVSTASAEVFGCDGTLGIPPTSRLQMVVRTDLPGALDLTDPDVLKALSIERKELIQIPDPLILDSIGRPTEYELPQMIGDVAYELEIPTILYPSARIDPGANVVVFVEYLAKNSHWIETENPLTGAPERIP